MTHLKDWNTKRFPFHGIFGSFVKSTSGQSHSSNSNLAHTYTRCLKKTWWWRWWLSTCI